MCYQMFPRQPKCLSASSDTSLLNNDRKRTTHFKHHCFAGADRGLRKSRSTLKLAGRFGLTNIPTILSFFSSLTEMTLKYD